MVARAIIGDIGSGRFGIKTSLPGVDALTADDSDPELFSLCSDWESLVRLTMVGTASVTFTSAFGNIAAVIPETDLPPFYEVREMSGRIFYDDRCNGNSNTVGASTNVTDTTQLGISVRFNATDTGLGPFTKNVFYIIYNVLTPWVP